MKINMKLYLPLFTLILMAAFLQQLKGQQLCGGTPDEHHEYMSCNRVIAETFAPKLVQYVDECDEESEDGASNRITKANWDNDWDATNNWQSVEEYTGNNTGWDNSPYGYYAVYWTPDEWVIVYSYFYSRDYARTNVGCGEDEHENDLARVLVVVKRPVTGLEKPEDLLLGFMTSPDDKERCISTDVNDDDYNVEITALPSSGVPGDVALGAHPIIYSSAGSHHFYTTENRGFEDAIGNKLGSAHCRPVPVSKINYLPAYHDSNISGFVPIEHDLNNVICLSHCTKIYSPDEVDDCSSHDEYYGLIDVMGGGGDGLWQQRNDSLLFSAPPTSEQHFLADDGGGSNGQGIERDAFAAAPWNGTMGTSPLTMAAEQLSPFDCECNENSNCQAHEITNCSYVYNPYICESYKIETPKNFDYENAWVENPHNDSGNLIVVFTLSAFDGYTGSPSSIEWDWDAPPGKTVSCLLGCPPNGGNRLMLNFEKTTASEIEDNLEDYSISVSANFLECGLISDSLSLSAALNGFVETTPNCDKIIFEIADDHHIDGNEYDWSFPLYDNLATFINDGRKVEFNTQSVKQQTSTTTNPRKELAYSLTVSNPIFPSDVNVTGKEKIPECDIVFGPQLRIFPNPTSQNDVYLDFERIDLNNEDITINVFDHQLRMVTSKQCTGMEPSLDISSLGNGLYFICVTTKDGKMMNEKILH